MRNQKRIDIEKFRKMWWKLVDGELEGCQKISREVFGSFFVTFRKALDSGKTTVEIKNYEYSILNKERREYNGFIEAVSAVAEYFDKVDEIIKERMQGLKDKAREAYRNIVGQEVEKIAREVI